MKIKIVSLILFLASSCILIAGNMFDIPFISNHKPATTAEIRLKYDEVVWGVTTSFNIINNDSLVDEVGNRTPILLGQNANATIEMVGNWPQGLSLNTQTGVVSINQAQLVSKPLGNYEYKICVGALCKEGSFSFQDIVDGLKVTQVVSKVTLVKNSDILTHTIEIENTSDIIGRVDFNFLLTTNTNITHSKEKITINSWTLSGFENNSTGLLQVDNANKLSGSLILKKGKATVIVNTKVQAVTDPNFIAKVSVFSPTITDNFLSNNSQSSSIGMQIFPNDLKLTTYASNPYTYKEDNIFTIKLTNVGSQPIVSSTSNNPISVSWIIPYTAYSGTYSNEIIVVAPNNYFTITNDYQANTTRKHTATVHNNITIPVGDSIVFKFKKEHGFLRLNLGENQVQTLNFNLTYASDSNTSNNSSNVTIENSPNPGVISLDENTKPLLSQKDVCFDGSATIHDKQSATSNVTGSGSTIRYRFQISTDNGLNWSFVKDKENKIIENTSSSTTIHNITEKILVRRYVRNTLNSDTLSSLSNVLVLNPVRNEITFPNNTNSFALSLPVQAGGTQLAANAVSFQLPNIYTKLPSKVKITGTSYDANSNTLNQFTTNELTTTIEGVNNVYNPNSTINIKEGLHRFMVTSTTISNNCPDTAYFQVVVYDVTKCFISKKKTFATHARSWTSGLSGVDKPEQAVNGERANAATLTGGVVLLGIGTVGIDLYFTEKDAAGNVKLMEPNKLKGKKVTLKLGEQYSGLKVAGGLSIKGLNVPTTTSLTALTLAPPSAGGTFGVKGGVLDALKGDNVFEYTFTPTSLNGTPVNFNGIRLQLGSLIGVADLASVFYAYVEDEVNIDQSSTAHCNDTLVRINPPESMRYPTQQNDVEPAIKLGPINNTNFPLNSFVEDAFWGNYTEVLNVASGLSSVVYPYYAVDNDYESYALFNATAGVLNSQFLQVKLKQQARPGDQVQITLAYPNINVLNLSLLQLGNFKLVYYLEGAKVGEEPLEQFRVLDIGLFNFKSKRRMILSKPVNFIFDKIELVQFNTVSVNLGDGLHIHDIRINPLLAFAGQNDPKQVTKICATDKIGIESPDLCTTYEVSFARVLQYGDTYKNADGSPFVDYKGNPIKSILAKEDIPNSTLTFSHYGPANTTAFYNINRRYGQDDGYLLLKIQAKRQNCNYGAPQYLRIDLENCQDAIVNPVIKFQANY